MTGFLFGVGVVLLVLDRLIYGTTAIRIQERLNYYIFYYRPMFRRHQFFVLVGLAVCVSILVNYVIFGEANILSHLVLFLLLLALIYVLLFLMTLFDSLVLRDIDLHFHFYSLEKDFIQLFSLGIFFPLIYLAYIVEVALNLFRYPSRGFYCFKSFAGLAGLLSLGTGLIMLFL